MKLTEKIKKESLRAFLLIIVILIAGYFVSWLITCGLIFLICKCFDQSFSWGVATGIWLILIILKIAFQPSKSAHR